MEQQLVKLIEQNLWAMAIDPAFDDAVSASGHDEDQSLSSVDPTSVRVEPWMESEDAMCKRKSSETKKQKRRKQVPRALPERVVEQVAEDDDAVLVEALSGDSVPFEPWMADLVSKTPKSSKRSLPSAGGSLEPRVEEQAAIVGEQALDESCADSRSVGHDEPAASDQEDEDDDVVGTGILHVSSEASIQASPRGSDCDCDFEPSPTDFMASTEAIDTGQSQNQSWNQQSSLPSSPLARHRSMPPRQLVCYVWQQTSQLESQLDLPWESANVHPESIASTTPGINSRSAFSRGSWRGPSKPGTPMAGPGSPVLTAVVRNTFVDIDDATSRQNTGSERPRSLTPNLRMQEKDMESAGTWGRGPFGSIPRWG